MYVCMYVCIAPGAKASGGDKFYKLLGVEKGCAEASIRMCIHIYIYIYIYTCVCVFIYIYIYIQPIYLSIYLPIYLSPYLSLSLFLSFSLSLTNIIYIYIHNICI